MIEEEDDIYESVMEFRETSGFNELNEESSLFMSNYSSGTFQSLIRSAFESGYKKAKEKYDTQRLFNPTLFNMEQSNAIVLRIDNKESSYGIFFIGENGDLFLNSDYGYYCYMWRSFSGTFKEFLGQCNSDYLVGKFEINYREQVGKKLPDFKKNHIKNLLKDLIKYCNGTEKE